MNTISTTAKPSESTKDVNAAQKAEKVHVLLLSEIEADWKWNVRTAVRDDKGQVTSTGATVDITGATEFLGIKESIAADGQKEPVVVRPHPTGKGGKKYHLVSGYQRTEALAQLARERGDKQPTVKAFVRTLSDKEARIENIAENTSRSELSGPDITRGVRMLKEMDSTLSDSAIARLLGKSQGYISRLSTIVSKVKPEAIELWNQFPGQFSVTDMESVAKEETGEAQVEKMRAKTEKKQGKRGPDGWAESAAKEAHVIGAALGVAEARGELTIANPRTFFREFLGDFVVGLKKEPEGEGDKVREARQKHVALIDNVVTSFRDGFAAGKKRVKDAAKA